MESDHEAAQRYKRQIGTLSAQLRKAEAALDEATHKKPKRG